MTEHRDGSAILTNRGDAEILTDRAGAAVLTDRGGAEVLVQAAADLQQVVDGARLSGYDVRAGDVGEVGVDQVQRQVVDDTLDVGDLVLRAGRLLDNTCRGGRVLDRHSD